MALSLLGSPNRRLAELHTASRSTQAREQLLSGSILRTASLRSAPTIVSELNNSYRLAAAVPRTLVRSLSMDLPRGTSSKYKSEYNG